MNIRFAPMWQRGKKIASKMFFGGFFSFFFLLNACSEQSDDLQTYLKNIKQQPLKYWPPLPFFQNEILKLGHVKRDPFHQDDKHFEKLTFSLKQLHFIGVLKEHQRVWGLVQQPDGQVLSVKIGDQLGAEKGKVLFIENNFLRLQVGSKIHEVQMG